MTDTTEPEVPKVQVVVARPPETWWAKHHVVPVLAALSVALNFLGLLGIAFTTTNTNHTAHASRSNGKDIRAIAVQTRALVEQVKDQTSPEAQRRQGQALDQIIVRIQCVNAENIDKALKGLADQGFIQGFSIISANCSKTQPKESP